jgi:serine/threonine protein kinase
LLLEQIGRGGMARVFKARDLENRGEIVAVKLPLPQYASGVGSWSMSQRESEIGASLNHPYVLRFIPLTPNRPRSMVVTEYVAGTTLADRIGKGRSLPEAEALEIARRVCEAVEYLHSQRIVHYDIKPRNVMLCDDGSIRLIDFGVAHALVAGRFAFAGRAPQLATADYVAPEQIGGRRGQTSVDIYGVGVLLYEMLTGHPPFEGDDPFVVASARRIGDPTAPRVLNPNISLVTEEIVLRALRRDPRERYASAAELRADLERPAGVRMSGLAARLVKVTPWRKRRRLMRYIAVVGGVPIAALVGSFRLLWWYLERKH